MIQSATPEATMRTAKPQRTWPAIVTLYLLAPIMGEVMSWSTPPLSFVLNPYNLIFEPALYGSGAILIRELVRRNGGGWGNILVLGAAYGVLEEGVDVQTWFNPAGLHGLGIYGRAWDINWIWALGLTVFHMVCSITVPILLTDSLFARLADRPWLGRGGRRWLVVWLAITVTIGALGFGLINGKKTGYLHPPLLQYLLAIGITLLLYALGRRLHFPAPSTRSTRPPPGLWALRLAAFGTTVVFFLAFYALPAIVPLAAIEAAVLVAIVACAVLQTRRWAARSGWGNAQWLGLASGVVGFWIAVSPVFLVTGLPAVALALLIVLVQLARKQSTGLPSDLSNPISAT